EGAVSDPREEADLGGTGIGRDQVQEAVAVQVHNQDRVGVVAGRRWRRYPRKAALPVPQEHRELVVHRVRGDDVRVAVVVQVTRRDRYRLRSGWNGGFLELELPCLLLEEDR